MDEKKPFETATHGWRMAGVDFRAIPPLEWLEFLILVEVGEIAKLSLMSPPTPPAVSKAEAINIQ